MSDTIIPILTKEQCIEKLTEAGRLLDDCERCEFWKVFHAQPQRFCELLNTRLMGEVFTVETLALALRDVIQGTPKMGDA